MASRNADEISGSNNGNNETNKDSDKQHTPVAKKLKSSPTDLVIRIGEEKYEYHCHSMIMAYHSVFIDTALASPMQESQTRVIDLPDVTPKTWDLMMQFLDTPSAAPRLKISLYDVVSVAEKFDEYEFRSGSALCSMHITHLYEAFKRRMDSSLGLRDSGTLNSLIKCALRCNQINLKGCMPAIIAFFRRALALPNQVGNHCGGLVFMPEHLKELAPFIAENNLLGNAWTKEEIQCPLFPKHFLSTMLQEYEQKRFGPQYRRQSMERVRLQLTKTNEDTCDLACLEVSPGIPRSTRTPTYVGGPRPRSQWNVGLGARIVLHKPENRNWVIAVPRARDNNQNRRRVGQRALWFSPMSYNCNNFPPEKPWIKLDNDAPAGTLKVVPGSPNHYMDLMMGRMMENARELDIPLPGADPEGED